MILRSSFIPLIDHLLQKQITVITGMRRVGKSTAIQYLLTKVAHKNKTYFDCERVEIRVLFNRPDYESIAEELQLGGLDFSKPCVIAFDEIQLIPNLPSLIKYIYDTYKVKFIVTGSSSYYMKNLFSESLAGRKKIFEMYPLSFKEFLVFKKAGIPQIDKYAWQSFKKAWYNRCKLYYEEYIQYGGFPEVVLQENIENKKDLLKDIINSYIELDVKLLSDYSASEDLYKLLRLLAARAGNKIDYSKLSSVAGISRQKLTAYIHLLQYTYMIYLIKPFTRNIDKEISQQPKLYFADTGILNMLAGQQISSGPLFENSIAAQLYSLGDLNYYQKKTGQEIDFIYNQSHAMEVKETAIDQDYQLLIKRASEIGLQKQILISRFAAKSGFDKFVWGGNIF